MTVPSLLERWLVRTVRAFEPFIEDWIVPPVAPGQIDLSDLASGVIRLRSIQLRPRAVTAINLPFELVFSYVGEIRVRIPVLRLFSGAPVEVSVTDVIVVVRSTSVQSWNNAAFVQQYLSGKRATLASQEARALADPAENSKGWLFGMQIAKNCALRLRNLHVRFEDQISVPGRPYAVGVQIREVSAVSLAGGGEDADDLTGLGNVSLGLSAADLATEGGSESQVKLKSVLYYKVSVSGLRPYVDAMDERARAGGRRGSSSSESAIFSLPLPYTLLRKPRCLSTKSRRGRRGRGDRGPSIQPRSMDNEEEEPAERPRGAAGAASENAGAEGGARSWVHRVTAKVFEGWLLRRGAPQDAADAPPPPAAPAATPASTIGSSPSVTTSRRRGRSRGRPQRTSAGQTESSAWEGHENSTAAPPDAPAAARGFECFLDDGGRFPFLDRVKRYCRLHIYDPARDSWGAAVNPGVPRGGPRESVETSDGGDVNGRCGGRRRRRRAGASGGRRGRAERRKSARGGLASLSTARLRDVTAEVAAGVPANGLVALIRRKGREHRTRMRALRPRPGLGLAAGPRESGPRGAPVGGQGVFTGVTAPLAAVRGAALAGDTSAGRPGGGGGTTGTRDAPSSAEGHVYSYEIDPESARSEQFAACIRNSFSSFHDYVITPMSIAVTLRAAACPIRVKEPPPNSAPQMLFAPDAPAARADAQAEPPPCVFSQADALFKPSKPATVPSALLDLSLGPCRVGFRRAQVENLRQWVDYHFILNSRWKRGLISQCELIGPPAAAEQMVYEEYWLKLLLRRSRLPPHLAGISADDEGAVRAWCEAFEDRYPCLLVQNVRADVLQRFRRLQAALHAAAISTANDGGAPRGLSALWGKFSQWLTTRARVNVNPGARAEALPADGSTPREIMAPASTDVQEFMQTLFSAMAREDPLLTRVGTAIRLVDYSESVDIRIAADALSVSLLLSGEADERIGGTNKPSRKKRRESDALRLLGGREESSAIPQVVEASVLIQRTELHLRVAADSGLRMHLRVYAVSAFLTTPGPNFELCHCFDTVARDVAAVALQADGSGASGATPPPPCPPGPAVAGLKCGASFAALRRQAVLEVLRAHMSRQPGFRRAESHAIFALAPGDPAPPPPPDGARSPRTPSPSAGVSESQQHHALGSFFITSASRFVQRFGLLDNAESAADLAAAHSAVAPSVEMALATPGARVAELPDTWLRLMVHSSMAVLLEPLLAVSTYAACIPLIAAFPKSEVWQDHFYTLAMKSPLKRAEEYASGIMGDLVEAGGNLDMEMTILSPVSVAVALDDERGFEGPGFALRLERAAFRMMPGPRRIIGARQRTRADGNMTLAGENRISASFPPPGIDEYQFSVCGLEVKRSACIADPAWSCSPTCPPVLLYFPSDAMYKAIETVAGLPPSVRLREAVAAVNPKRWKAYLASVRGARVCASILLQPITLENSVLRIAHPPYYVEEGLGIHMDVPSPRIAVHVTDGDILQGLRCARSVVQVMRVVHEFRATHISKIALRTAAHRLIFSAVIKVTDQLHADTMPPLNPLDLPPLILANDILDGYLRGVEADRSEAAAIIGGAPLSCELCGAKTEITHQSGGHRGFPQSRVASRNDDAGSDKTIEQRGPAGIDSDGDSLFASCKVLASSQSSAASAPLGSERLSSGALTPSFAPLNPFDPTLSPSTVASPRRDSVIKKGGVHTLARPVSSNDASSLKYIARSACNSQQSDEPHIFTEDFPPEFQVEKHCKVTNDCRIYSSKEDIPGVSNRWFPGVLRPEKRLTRCEEPRIVIHVRMPSIEVTYEFADQRNDVHRASSTPSTIDLLSSSCFKTHAFVGGSTLTAELRDISLSCCLQGSLQAELFATLGSLTVTGDSRSFGQDLVPIITGAGSVGNSSVNEIDKLAQLRSCLFHPSSEVSSSVVSGALTHFGTDTTDAFTAMTAGCSWAPPQLPARFLTTFAAITLSENRSANYPCHPFATSRTAFSECTIVLSQSFVERFLLSLNKLLGDIVLLEQQQSQQLQQLGDREMKPPDYGKTVSANFDKKVALKRKIAHMVDASAAQSYQDKVGVAITSEAREMAEVFWNPYFRPPALCTIADLSLQFHHISISFEETKLSQDVLAMRYAIDGLNVSLIGQRVHRGVHEFHSLIGRTSKRFVWDAAAAWAEDDESEENDELNGRSESSESTSYSGVSRGGGSHKPASKVPPGAVGGDVGPVNFRAVYTAPLGSPLEACEFGGFIYAPVTAILQTLPSLACSLLPVDLSFRGQISSISLGIREPCMGATPIVLPFRVSLDVELQLPSTRAFAEKMCGFSPSDSSHLRDALVLPREAAPTVRNRDLSVSFEVEPIEVVLTPAPLAALAVLMSSVGDLVEKGATPHPVGALETSEADGEADGGFDGHGRSDGNACSSSCGSRSVSGLSTTASDASSDDGESFSSIGSLRSGSVFTQRPSSPDVLSTVLRALQLSGKRVWINLIETSWVTATARLELLRVSVHGEGKEQIAAFQIVCEEINGRLSLEPLNRLVPYAQFMYDRAPPAATRGLNCGSRSTVLERPPWYRKLGSFGSFMGSVPDRAGARSEDEGAHNSSSFASLEGSPFRPMERPKSLAARIHEGFKNWLRGNARDSQLDSAVSWVDVLYFDGHNPFHLTVNSRGKTTHEALDFAGTVGNAAAVNGDIRRTRWRLAVSGRRPWLCADGDLSVFVQHAILAERQFEATLEPCHVAVTLVRRQFEGTTRLAIAVSWLNLTVDMALVNCAFRVLHGVMDGVRNLLHGRRDSFRPPALLPALLTSDEVLRALHTHLCPPSGFPSAPAAQTVPPGAGDLRVIPSGGGRRGSDQVNRSSGPSAGAATTASSSLLRVVNLLGQPIEVNGVPLAAGESATAAAAAAAATTSTAGGGTAWAAGSTPAPVDPSRRKIRRVTVRFILLNQMFELRSGEHFTISEEDCRIIHVLLDSPPEETGGSGTLHGGGGAARGSGRVVPFRTLPGRRRTSRISLHASGASSLRALGCRPFLPLLARTTRDGNRRGALALTLSSAVTVRNRTPFSFRVFPTAGEVKPLHALISAVPNNAADAGDASKTSCAALAEEAPAECNDLKRTAVHGDVVEKDSTTAQEVHSANCPVDAAAADNSRSPVIYVVHAAALPPPTPSAVGFSAANRGTPESSKRRQSVGTTAAQIFGTSAQKAASAGVVSVVGVSTVPWEALAAECTARWAAARAATHEKEGENEWVERVPKFDLSSYFGQSSALEPPPSAGCTVDREHGSIFDENAELQASAGAPRSPLGGMPTFRESSHNPSPAELVERTPRFMGEDPSALFSNCSSFDEDLDSNPHTNQRVLVPETQRGVLGIDFIELQPDFESSPVAIPLHWLTLLYAGLGIERISPRTAVAADSLPAAADQDTLAANALGPADPVSQKARSLRLAKMSITNSSAPRLVDLFGRRVFVAKSLRQKIPITDGIARPGHGFWGSFASTPPIAIASTRMLHALLSHVPTARYEMLELSPALRPSNIEFAAAGATAGDDGAAVSLCVGLSVFAVCRPRRRNDVRPTDGAGAIFELVIEPCIEFANRVPHAVVLRPAAPNGTVGPPQTGTSPDGPSLTAAAPPKASACGTRIPVRGASKRKDLSPPSRPRAVTWKDVAVHAAAGSSSSGLLASDGELPSPVSSSPTPRDGDDSLTGGGKVAACLRAKGCAITVAAGKNEFVCAAELLDAGLLTAFDDYTALNPIDLKKTTPASVLPSAPFVVAYARCLGISAGRGAGSNSEFEFARTLRRFHWAKSSPRGGSGLASFITSAAPGVAPHSGSAVEPLEMIAQWSVFNPPDARLLGSRKIQRVFSRSLAKTLTLYPTAWVMNRLPFPLYVSGGVEGGACALPNKRTLLSSGCATARLRISPPSHAAVGTAAARSMHLIRAWRSGGSASDSFKVVDFASVDVRIPGSNRTPQLSLTAVMSKAPLPFSRTSVIELRPKFILVNSLATTLYVREFQGSKASALLARSLRAAAAGDGVVRLFPGDRVEYNPQLPRRKPRIQVTAAAAAFHWFRATARRRRLLEDGRRNARGTVAAAAGGAGLTDLYSRDGFLWSPPIRLNAPCLLQVRHAGAAYGTWSAPMRLFTSTEVQIVVQSGTHFTRFLEPGVPEYRLVNLTQAGIALGQQKCDIFDILGGDKVAHAALDGPGEIRALQRKSLPFTFHCPKRPRRLQIWLEPQRAMAMPASPKDAHDRGGPGARLPDEEEDDASARIARMVAVARQRHKARAVSKVGAQRVASPVAASPANLKRVDRAAKQRYITCRLYRGDFCSIFDVDAQFKRLKQRRLAGTASPLVLTLPLRDPENPFGLKLLQVLITVVAGTRWILFERLLPPSPLLRLPPQLQLRVLRTKDQRREGSLFFHQQPVPPAAPIVSAERCQKLDDDAINLFVLQLYVQAHAEGPGQHDSARAVKQIAQLAKDPDVARFVARIHVAGTREVRREVRRAVFQISGVDLEHMARIEDKKLRVAGVAGADRKEDKGVLRATDSNILPPMARTQVGAHNEVDDTLVIADHAAQEPAALERTMAESEGRRIPSVRVGISLGGVGVSLIDRLSLEPREVAYFGLARLCLTARFGAEENKFHVAVGWVQLDDPAEHAFYPICVRPVTDAFSGAQCGGGGQRQLLVAEKCRNLDCRALLPNDLIPDRGDLTAAAPPSEFESGGAADVSLAAFGVPDSFEFLSVDIRVMNTAEEEKNRNLLEIPAISLTLLPMAVSVDSQFLSSILILADDFICCIGPGRGPLASYTAPNIVDDGVSQTWIKEGGSVSAALHAENAAVSKIFVGSLEIASITLVLNYRKSRSRNSAPQSLAPAAAIRAREKLEDFQSRDGRSSVNGNKKPAGKTKPAESPTLARIRNGFSAAALGREFVDETQGAAVQRVDEPQDDLIRGVLTSLPFLTILSDVTITLSRRIDRDLCGTAGQLALLVGTSYITPGVRQVHKLLGAFDVMGNPSVMCRHVYYGATNGCRVLGEGASASYRGRREASYAETFRSCAAACGRCGSSGCVGLAAGLLDCISRFSGSWFTICNRLSRNADKYSLFPDLVLVKPDQVHQPASLFEGCWSGVTRSFINVAIVAANVVYKPCRGIVLKNLELSATGGVAGSPEVSACERLDAAATGCWLGCCSGLAGFCTGVPTTALLCCYQTSAGALRQISDAAAMRRIRPRRRIAATVAGYNAATALLAMLAEDNKLRASARNVAGCISLSAGNSSTHVQPLWLAWDDAQKAEARHPRLRRLIDTVGENRATRYVEKDSTLLVFGAYRMGLFVKRVFAWTVLYTDICGIEVVQPRVNIKGTCGPRNAENFRTSDHTKNGKAVDGWTMTHTSKSVDSYSNHQGEGGHSKAFDVLYATSFYALRRSDGFNTTRGYLPSRRRSPKGHLLANEQVHTSPHRRLRISLRPTSRRRRRRSAANKGRAHQRAQASNVPPHALSWRKEAFNSAPNSSACRQRLADGAQRTFLRFSICESTVDRLRVNNGTHSSSQGFRPALVAPVANYEVATSVYTLLTHTTLHPALT